MSWRSGLRFSFCTRFGLELGARADGPENRAGPAKIPFQHPTGAARRWRAPHRHRRAPPES